jgi:hypothetical protein
MVLGHKEYQQHKHDVQNYEHHNKIANHVIYNGLGIINLYFIVIM